MNAAARSVLAFGIYLALLGLLLITVPSQTCSVIGLKPPGKTMWVRLSGALFLNLAFYCVRAARSGRAEFLRWSTMTRPLTIVFLGAIVAVGLENPVVLLFGVVDLAAAFWTVSALRTAESRS